MSSTIETRARELVAIIDAGGLAAQGVLSCCKELVGAVHEAADSPDDAYFRNLAQELARDGELEVDEDAVVSVSSDGGAYVAAWVWVYDDRAAGEDEEYAFTDIDAEEEAP